MPEYFVSLVKQYGNLLSTKQAKEVILEISEGLELTLPNDTAKILFGYAPDYIIRNKPRFLLSRRQNNHNYNHTTLLSRLKIEQSLTDNTEVENRLKAYFAAIKIVVGNKKYAGIYSVLPGELKIIAT